MPDLEFYKEKLGKEKKDLEEQIDKLETTKTDFGSDVDSGEEETDETEEIGNKLGIIQSLKKRLEEIEQALSKFETGAYGICEKCGEKISDILLEKNPESKLCKNCKLSAK